MPCETSHDSHQPNTRRSGVIAVSVFLFGIIFGVQLHSYGDQDTSMGLLDVEPGGTDPSVEHETKSEPGRSREARGNRSLLLDVARTASIGLAGATQSGAGSEATEWGDLREELARVRSEVEALRKESAALSRNGTQLGGTVAVSGDDHRAGTTSTVASQTAAAVFALAAHSRSDRPDVNPPHVQHLASEATATSCCKEAVQHAFACGWNQGLGQEGWSLVSHLPSVYQAAESNTHAHFFLKLPDTITAGSVSTSTNATLWAYVRAPSDEENSWFVNGRSWSMPLTGDQYKWVAYGPVPPSNVDSVTRDASVTNISSFGADPHASTTMRDLVSASARPGSKLVAVTISSREPGAKLRAVAVGSSMPDWSPLSCEAALGNPPTDEIIKAWEASLPRGGSQAVGGAAGGAEGTTEGLDDGLGRPQDYRVVPVEPFWDGTYDTYPKPIPRDFGGPPADKAKGRYAYVTMMTAGLWNNRYVCLALAHVTSLQQTDSGKSDQIDVVIALLVDDKSKWAAKDRVGPDDVPAIVGAEAYEAFRAAGVDRFVVWRELDAEGKTLSGYWKQAFSKLRVWELVEYEKILFMDSDVFVLKNLDHLFQEEDFTAAASWNCINGVAPRTMSGGFWILRPSMKIMELIRRYLAGRDPCGWRWHMGDMTIPKILFTHMDAYLNPSVNPRAMGRNIWPVYDGDIDTMRTGGARSNGHTGRCQFQNGLMWPHRVDEYKPIDKGGAQQALSETARPTSDGTTFKLSELNRWHALNESYDIWVGPCDNKDFNDRYGRITKGGDKRWARDDAFAVHFSCGRKPTCGKTDPSKLAPCQRDMFDLWWAAFTTHAPNSLVSAREGKSD